MTTDKLQNLSNDDLSRLAAEAQGDGYAWIASVRWQSGEKIPSGTYKVDCDFDCKIPCMAPNLDFPCVCKFGKKYFNEDECHYGPNYSRYSPPTNLPQAAELFMGMSEKKQCGVMRHFFNETHEGEKHPKTAYGLMLIARCVLDPRQLTIACLAAMEVG